jgi:hypothetical protein
MSAQGSQHAVVVGVGLDDVSAVVVDAAAVVELDFALEELDLTLLELLDLTLLDLTLLELLDLTLLELLDFDVALDVLVVAVLVVVSSSADDGASVVVTNSLEVDCSVVEVSYSVNILLVIAPPKEEVPFLTRTWANTNTEGT